MLVNKQLEKLLRRQCMQLDKLINNKKIKINSYFFIVDIIDNFSLL